MDANDAITVKALKATALPAVSRVSATAATTPAWSPVCTSSALQGGAEAHDEEEGVVDTEGQGEHQGEIEGPDRHGRYLGGEHQGTGGHHEADQGEHERQAGGDKAAEGEPPR